MTVRPAKASDIMRVLVIADEARRNSVYAQRCPIDRGYAQKFFAKAVHTHGFHHHGGTFFLVSERNGMVEGYFLGVLDRIYQIGERLVALEVHTLLSPRASRRDWSVMVSRFIAWAEGNDDVLEIFMAQSTLMGTEDRRYATALKRKGFAHCGTNFIRPVREPGAARAALEMSGGAR